MSNTFIWKSEYYVDQNQVRLNSLTTCTNAKYYTVWIYEFELSCSSVEGEYEINKLQNPWRDLTEFAILLSM